MWVSRQLDLAFNEDAMSKVTGRAKKYNGTAIDYVLLFDWITGNCIGKAIPDAAGVWNYEYFENISCGITYVADGCEPISHGPYNLVVESLVPTDTILHYTFNGHINDNSGASLHGVPSGNVSFVSGRKEGLQAIRFTGGNIKTPRSLPINSDKLTVSFWFNTTQNDLAMIMGSNIASNANMIDILTNSSSEKRMSVQDVSSTNSYTNKSSDTIPKGVWNHFIVTVDRSLTGDASLNVFLNGTQVPSTPDTSANIQGMFANNVIIIGNDAFGYFPYDGLLQDFRVYNRVLDTQERLLLLNE